jgi:predicted NBD/HSP70 family sugar kinase
MKFTTLKDQERQYSHQSAVKETNIKQIFDLIRNYEGLSRIEISKRTGLSRATVSMLVAILAKIGLINILGEGDTTTSGRKPIMLEINKDRLQIISLSLKKSVYIYTLYDLKGNEIDTFTHPVVYKKGCGKKIWNEIQVKSSHMSSKKLLAVCAAIPEQIRTPGKTIIPSILDIEKNCDLVAELKAMQPKIPLLVGNQTSALAYAEYKYTYNGQIDEMIYFVIDEGVAAGILLNGRVFTGEIGHMTLEPGGRRCACGKRGCVESIISKAELLSEFGSLVKKNKDCCLHKLCGGDAARVNYGNIRTALENQDPKTTALAEQMAGKIALCISNVICMFNSREIIIGGGIEELGTVFLGMISKKVEIPGNDGTGVPQNMPVRLTKCGKNAEIQGLFGYFLDKVFSIMDETETAIQVWN